jgi:hypothetical protein
VLIQDGCTRTWEYHGAKLDHDHWDCKRNTGVVNNAPLVAFNMHPARLRCVIASCDLSHTSIATTKQASFVLEREAIPRQSMWHLLVIPQTQAGSCIGRSVSRSK